MEKHDFKVGDWVRWLGYNEVTGKVVGEPEGKRYLELEVDGYLSTHDSCYVGNLRKATPEEIRKACGKVEEEYKFNVGDLVSPIKDWCDCHDNFDLDENPEVKHGNYSNKLNTGKVLKRKNGLVLVKMKDDLGNDKKDLIIYLNPEKLKLVNKTETNKIKQDEVFRENQEQRRSRIKGSRVCGSKVKIASGCRPNGSEATNLRRRNEPRATEIKGRKILFN